MRVLPCFTTMDLRSMVSRIRRSASSRIDCFDIHPHLCCQPKAPYSIRIAHTRKITLETINRRLDAVFAARPVSRRQLPDCAFRTHQPHAGPGNVVLLRARSLPNLLFMAQLQQ